MRRALLAAVAAAAVALASPAMAGGIPVIDVASLTQLVMTAKTDLQSLTELENQGVTLNNQLTQAKNIFASISHVTNASQLVGVLNELGLENPMPGNLATLEQLFDGAGVPGGYQGTVQRILSNINGYAPQGTDFQAGQINQSQVSVAGQQSLAEQMYEANSQRLTGIQNLQNQLAGAEDLKTSTDLGVRMQSEVAKGIAQNNQATSALMLQQAQQAQQQQTQEQAWRYSADKAGQDARAAVTAAEGGQVQLMTGGN